MATLRLAMLTKGKAFGQDCLIPGRFQHWRANKAAFSLTFLQTSVRLSLTFLQTLGMSLSHLPSDLATDGSVAVRSACILLWSAFSPRPSLLCGCCPIPRLSIASPTWTSHPSLPSLT